MKTPTFHIPATFATVRVEEPHRFLLVDELLKPVLPVEFWCPTHREFHPIHPLMLAMAGGILPATALYRTTAPLPAEYLPEPVEAAKFVSERLGISPRDEKHVTEAAAPIQATSTLGGLAPEEFFEPGPPVIRPIEFVKAAYHLGATLQAKTRHLGGDWKTIDDEPLFLNELFTYRVTPEQEALFSDAFSFAPGLMAPPESKDYKMAVYLICHVNGGAREIRPRNSVSAWSAQDDDRNTYDWVNFEYRPAIDLPKPVAAAPELPKWKCHKVVGAFKIGAVRQTRGPATPETEAKGGTWQIFDLELTMSVEVNHAWILKHDPHHGGYFIRYEDGYESYSPAEAFESGYSRVVTAA